MLSGSTAPNVAQIFNSSMQYTKSLTDHKRDARSGKDPLSPARSGKAKAAEIMIKDVHGAGSLYASDLNNLAAQGTSINLKTSAKLPISPRHYPQP